ncbi:hypothetical protein [Humisphaera borealis]|uniref:Uncharacterized protein n=1 Tax=Humisphaera borealis TaxID=2807512 RepID=A0A7M2WYD6_9BACT|nr:hypothetical protein [Humisphaera borealis]QOV89540.1 hypothetical protein IPV69_25670 [Humisphaera borealis]
MTSGNDESFYVGYQPTPPGLRRWLLRVVAITLIGCCALIAVLAAGQRDPGRGVWQIDDVQTFTGMLRSSPYLTLVEDSGRALLLTGPTKQSADDWAHGLIGKRVVVRGHAVTRGDLRLVSMAEEETPIVAADAASRPVGELLPATSAIVADVSTPVRLAGEIIDPKCYAGAMKPGDGKAHKACATLCIRGGIPPVLVTHTPDRTPAFLVLTDRDGQRLAGDRLSSILHLVAEPVIVTGRQFSRDGLVFIRVDEVERNP